MPYFGVATSPWDAPTWAAQTGIRPDFLATFENWSSDRTLADQLLRASQLGYRRYLVTWEPWEPSGSRISQPEWSPEAIVRGDHDDYIKAFAVAVRDSQMDEVFIRFAHEMNGDWYPWSQSDPALYVQAWIHVRLLFRQKNAFNAKWVWSPNADLYRNRPEWLKSVLPFWPGESKVDYVGLTTIGFGGTKNYTWQQYQDRLDLAAYIFQKPYVSSEMNTAYDTRINWFTMMSAEFAERPPTRPAFVCLSQGESYAQETLSTGNLSWSITDDPSGIAALQKVVAALH